MARKKPPADTGPSGRAAAWIEANVDAMVALEGELTRRNAVGPGSGGPGEAEKADWLAGWLAGNGFGEVQRVVATDNGVPRPNLLLTVPGRDRSDEVDKPRRIHKRGSKWLRWALVEAAVPATRSNLALKNLYDRVCRKKGPLAGPNVAKVAVARKLAEIVYRILVEERPYEIR